VGRTKGSAESLDQDRHLQEPMVMQGLEDDDDLLERLIFIFLFGEWCSTARVSADGRDQRRTIFWGEEED
jgi:hypothetical protein